MESVCMNSQDNDEMSLLIKACNENSQEATEALYLKIRHNPDNIVYQSRPGNDSDDNIHDLSFVLLVKE